MSTPIVYGNPLAVALGTARASQAERGLTKNPSYRIGNFRLTLAPDTLANPGYIYIKDKQYSYLGKISPQGVVISKGLDDFDKNFLSGVVQAPEAMAMHEGKTTGNCCCCGRLLTNKLSVELGIGPVCRGDFFPSPDLPDVSPDQDDLLDSLGSFESIAAEAIVQAAEEAVPNLGPVIDCTLLPSRKNILRQYWLAKGGTFHGPNVETGTMPEDLLLTLLDRLVQAEDDIHSISDLLAEGFKR